MVNKKILAAMESIYFTSKLVFYACIWAASLHYLSTTEYTGAHMWLTLSGLVGGILFLIMPIIRKSKFAKRGKNEAN